MLYQVTANLFFNKFSKAKDFFHDCEMACPKSIVLQEGKENEERGHCQLIHCHHDESPNKPCTLVREIYCPAKPPDDLQPL